MAKPTTEELVKVIKAHKANISTIAKGYGKSRSAVYDWIKSSPEATIAMNESRTLLFNESGTLPKGYANPDTPNDLPKGKLDKGKRFLYIVRETWRGMCKIGVASDIYARMSSLQTGCPQELEVVGFVALKNAKSMELFIHNRYKEFHHRGEWFNISNEQVQTILDFVNAEALID